MAISIPRFGIPAEIVSISGHVQILNAFSSIFFQSERLPLLASRGKMKQRTHFSLKLKISNNLNKAYLVLEESTGNAKGNNSAAIQCHSAQYCNKREQFSLCLYPRSSSLFLH